jgi:hypothetical protein
VCSLGNPAVATTTTTALIDSGTMEISIDSDPAYEVNGRFGSAGGVGG